MSELVDFLRARLAEDAEAARNASQGPWFADHPEPKHWGDDPGSALIVEGKILCILDNQYNGPLNADHIVRHEPRRVLAEVEAKRQIMTEHELVPATTGGGSGCAICAPVYSWGQEVVAGPCKTLCLLALPYADHPDYREEWKP